MIVVGGRPAAQADVTLAAFQTRMHCCTVPRVNLGQGCVAPVFGRLNGQCHVC